MTVYRKALNFAGLTLFTILLSTGCNKAQWGAGIGAGSGALAGGIIGHQSGHRTEGALIGTAVGAFGGYAVGNELDKADGNYGAGAGYQSGGYASGGSYSPPANSNAGNYYSSAPAATPMLDVDVNVSSASYDHYQSEPKVYKRHGPPAHEPAHGYRAKHKFYYYPDHEVYFNFTTGTYFWQDDGVWQSNRQLPVHINTYAAVILTVEIEGDTPYYHHELVRKKHPLSHSRKGLTHIPSGKVKKNHGHKGKAYRWN